MKISTADLTGAALDWAVAKCEGLGAHVYLEADGKLCFQSRLYNPSTDGTLAATIIERERIDVVRGNDLVFPKGNEKGEYSEPLWLASHGAGRKFHGPTPLIAAMRCYVASRLGDEVEVPDELLSGDANSAAGAMIARL